MSTVTIPIDAEPAKPSYFYGPGFIDMKKLAYLVLDKTRVDISDKAQKAQKRTDRWYVAADGLFSTAWAWLVTAVIYIYWIARATAQIFAGATFCLFMLIPQVVLFLLIEAVVLGAGALIRGIEWLLFKLRHISNVCEQCHDRFVMPIYLCPDCGEKHAHLQPNRYGMLHHTCTCGEKMPSSILCAKPSRNSLDAICPTCWSSGIETHINASGSRTLTIPVVGGVSSGKTSFITALITDLVESRAPSHGLTTSFPTADKESMYVSLKDSYTRGVVQKTATQQDKNKVSAISMSVLLSGGSLNPQRLLQLGDIAGETFVNRAEHEQQLQYAHCDGLILVIDPLSIPRARAELVGDKPIADTCPNALEDVMYAFAKNVVDVTNPGRDGKSSVPVAVVLNKVDEVPALQNRLDAPAIQVMKSKDAELYGDWFDDMDYLCRQFLYDMDMAGQVDALQQSFHTVRFFAVSSIGHPAGNGQAFTPQNVDEVLDWLLRLRDNDLADAMGSRKFSKATLPILEPAEGKFEALFGVPEAVE